MVPEEWNMNPNPNGYQPKKVALIHCSFATRKTIFFFPGLWRVNSKGDIILAQSENLRAGHPGER